MDFLKSVLLKSFDIRKGEFVPALLLMLNIFFIILTYITLKPTVNALFLSQFGVEQLPNAFILIAVVAGAISIFYSKLLLSVSLNRMMLYTVSSSLFFMLAFGVLLQLGVGEDVVLYTFYIWHSIFTVLATSQFWMLTNIVFSVRQAKRLFGLIGAGAIAGAILGGYLASVLAQVISSHNIVFVTAGLLLICVPITNYLWKGYVENKLNSFQRKKRSADFSSNPFAIVKKSKYLTLIAGIVGIGVVVSKLIDYQFSNIVTAQIDNADDLTSFFGFWFSTFNIISLAIQLFLTRRLIGVYGVGTSLLILPVGIAVATVLLLFTPVLWVAIFLQMNDNSLKNSLNRSAVELLSLPISIDIKSKVKTFIDVFVDRAATGLAGILLLLVLKALQLPAFYVNLLIIVLIGFWIYLASKIRDEYINSFHEKLSDPQEKLSTPIDLRKNSVFDGIIGVLQKGTDSQILFMLHKVYELADPKLFESLEALLHHPSDKIREVALQNLYLYKTPVIKEEVTALLKDSNDEVKIRAMEYLIARTSPEDRPLLIDSFINAEDSDLKGVALVTLAIQCRNNPVWKEQFKLLERIQRSITSIEKLPEGTQRETELSHVFQAITHAAASELYPFIQKHAKHASIIIAQKAYQAMGNSLSPVFLNDLLEALTHANLSKTAAKSLVNYGEGLVSHLKQPTVLDALSVKVARKLPQVLEKIGSQNSMNLLLKLLSFEDVAVRLETLRSMNELRLAYPFLKVNHQSVVELVTEEAKLYLDTLAVLYSQNQLANVAINQQEGVAIIDARRSLIKILEARLDGTLERIFRLIGLKYPPEKILLIFDGIQAKDTDFRINAIEYLDNLLELDLKKILIPIIETALMDEVSKEAIENLSINTLDDVHCFTMLMQGYDPKIKLAILHLISQLKDQRFLPIAEAYLNSDNSKVRDFALQTKQALTSIA